MVDEEVGADLRAGMQVHARAGVAHSVMMRGINGTWSQVQLVREPLHRDGFDDG